MTPHEKTPAEFTRDTPEQDPSQGSGAGPGSPETVEPTQGVAGDEGTGGPAMKGIGTESADDDADEAQEAEERRQDG